VRTSSIAVLLGTLGTLGTFGTSGCIPVMTPPLKIEGGGAARIGSNAGYRFGVGTHVASLMPSSDFPLDVGGGYIQTGTESNQHRLAVHGLYLEGGPRLAGGKNWRAFAGPRAEYYFAPQGPNLAYAGLVRASIEVMGAAEGEPVSSVGNRGFYAGIAFGMLAIGAWAEGGYQKLPTDAGLFMLGGGLHIRIPVTAGILCCAWDFKK
jgi:hypothetical protein